ncbi:hypothetical protein CcaverHIS002_0308650 [Cutaneotrichosporon cavernicola]|nr:hypothetical protein CcaverHIS002_0308650 [Cutaneotrichosporon cavernicola]
MVKGKGKEEVEHLSPVSDHRDATADAKAPPPSKRLVKNGTLTEEVEEIFSSTSEPDLDEKRRFWKPGMRTRRTSKPRPPEERPVSMSHVEQRPPLRRPQSSLFHNPFGRTQSRVSLTFELDQPSPVDDGSFQLKSFRHISGASDAEGGFGQYLSTKKTDEQRLSSHERSAASTIVPKRQGSATNSGLNSGATSPIPPPSPTAPHRPRPPSAADSESSQRVSVAAFRKNIRRPSSSVLIDDDDDVPLSLSRAQLFEGNGLRRDSGSAVSLTDHPSPPAAPKRSLPPTPNDESREPSPSPIGLGAPPPMRNSTSPSPGFVVKGARRNFDAKDAKKPDPISDRVPSPLPASAPIITGSPKVVRPPRASSLSTGDEVNDTLPILMTPRDDPTPLAGRRATSRSPPPPPPAPLNIPGPQASPDELFIMLPPRPDELPDGPTGRENPSRGATLSPTFAMTFDEPLRRISGLWSGSTPGQAHSDNEEAFDPSMVETTLPDRQRGSGGLDVPANQENRQSFYDRLAAATSSAITTASNALPTSTSSDERLYIPPIRTPSPPPIQARSPTSECTASPVPAPPVMAEAPAEVPAIPHSSFGRVPRLPADKPRGARANRQGWASSSDEDEDDRVRPRPATSASTITTRAMVAAPRPQTAATRPHSSATMLRDVELISGSSDEDEPLQTLKTSRSRSDLHELRPAMSRSSNAGLSVPKIKTPELPRPTSILKASTGNGHANGLANGHANAPTPRPRTGSMPNEQRAAVISSASKWSLSSAHDSEEEELSPPVRPGSRPASRNSAHSVSMRPPSRTAARPASFVSIATDSNVDRSRPVPRNASSDHMPKLRNRSSDVLPRNKSSDLLPSPTGTDRLRATPSAANMRQPAPRHPMSMVAAVDGRPTASPASSQSGLTGDSSGQQPMTPRSGADPARRSWADGRPRPDAEASPARRPASQFDWGSSAGQAGAQMPMAYQPGMDAYGAMNKQHMYAQFKAMADRHFEDMWERASSVGTANTAPQTNMFQQTYGYSYNQPPMPMMPQMPYGGYTQYPYGGFGGPQVAFPGGMPMGGMMPPMGGMPMQGMPMGGNGYSYGPGAQSVYGGEFGPPVAPGMRENQPGSPGGSPSRRTRHISGLTDVPAGRVTGRPSSVAQGSSSASVTGVSMNQYGQQRATPPRRQARRTSGLALSEAGPSSSWRASMADDLETPRPKRVTNAS